MRFNGATASEPWNLIIGSILLVRFRRFNGATASEPWNLRLLRASRRNFKSLQWGHGI